MIRQLLAEANPNFLDNAVNLPQDQALDPGFSLARDDEVTRKPYGDYKRGETGGGGYVQQEPYY